VQERGLQRGRIEPQVGEDLGDRHRVLDEVLAREPLLALVVLGGEPVGPLDLLQVGLGVVALDRPDQSLDAVERLGLARTQAGQDAASPFGPDLFARIHARRPLAPSISLRRACTRIAPAPAPQAAG
jgi:hypothetical protein